MENPIIAGFILIFIITVTFSLFAEKKLKFLFSLWGLLGICIVIVVVSIKITRNLV